MGFGEGLVVARCARAAASPSPSSAPASIRPSALPGIREDRFASLMAAHPSGCATSRSASWSSRPRSRARSALEEVELLQTCAQLIAPVVMNAQLLALVACSTAEEREQARWTSWPCSGLPMSMRRSGRASRSNVRAAGIAGRARQSPSARLSPRGSPRPLEHLSLRAERRPGAGAPRSAGGTRGGAARAARGARPGGRTLRPRVRGGLQYAHPDPRGPRASCHQPRAGGGRDGNALRALRTGAGRPTARPSRASRIPTSGSGARHPRTSARRVMAKLLGVRHHNVPLSEGAIVVVARPSCPTTSRRLEVEKIGAMVSEHGGATSHGAIFARSLEIPARHRRGRDPGCARRAVRWRSWTARLRPQVYLSPDAGLRTEYERAQHRYAVAVEHLDALGSGRPRPATAATSAVRQRRLVERPATGRAPRRRGHGPVPHRAAGARPPGLSRARRSRSASTSGSAESWRRGP